MGLQVVAQFVDQALDLAENDGDCASVRRLGDARSLVRLGRAGGEANELPRRRQPGP
jgi:hypothetical protein